MAHKLESIGISQLFRTREIPPQKAAFERKSSVNLKELLLKEFFCQLKRAALDGEAGVCGITTLRPMHTCDI